MGIIEGARTVAHEAAKALVEIQPRHFAACIRISPDQPNIDRIAPGATPGLSL